ncbi:MAG: hypothetical protein ACREMC_02755 [Gemmatimonadales bacterium]
MFGIPGEVFWPTVAFGAIILLVFGAVVVVRLLPQPKARVGDQPEREASELEERVDFAERIIAKQREGERLGLPPA